MLQLNFNLECRPCRRARPRWRECVSKLVLCNVFYVLKPQIFEALPARVCAAGRCFGRSVSLLFFTLQSTGSLALRAGRMVGEHLLQVWEMSLNLKSMDIAQGFLTWNCTGIWQMVFNDPWRQWTLSTWQGFGQFPFGVGGFPGQGVRVRDFSNCKSSTACHAIQVHLQVEMIGCTSQHLSFFCRMLVTSNTCNITFLCTIYIYLLASLFCLFGLSKSSVSQQSFVLFAKLGISWGDKRILSCFEQVSSCFDIVGGSRKYHDIPWHLRVSIV